MEFLISVVLTLIFVSTQATGGSLETIPGSVGNNILNHLLRMERSLTEMKSELDATKTSLKASLKANKELDATVASLKTSLKSNKKLDATVASLKTSLKANKEQMMTRIDSLQAEMQNLTKTHGRTGSVSFQVQQIKSQITMSNKEVLKFDAVTMNTGNAYNPNSGIFTAPVTGTYLFWANIMCYGQGDQYIITLQKEGKELTRGYPGYKIINAVATISYLTRLAEGNHVWFAFGKSGSTTTLFGDKYSNYGGTLL